MRGYARQLGEDRRVLSRISRRADARTTLPDRPRRRRPRRSETLMRRRFLGAVL